MRRKFLNLAVRFAIPALYRMLEEESFQYTIRISAKVRANREGRSTRPATGRRRARPPASKFGSWRSTTCRDELS